MLAASLVLQNPELGVEACYSACFGAKSVMYLPVRTLALGGRREEAGRGMTETVEVVEGIEVSEGHQPSGSRGWVRRVLIAHHPTRTHRLVTSAAAAGL